MTLAYAPRMAISHHFFDAYSRLPKQTQNKVSNFMMKFTQDPTQKGLNYESIHNARDKNMKSVRVDDKYRAIVLKPDQGDIYLLLWVDNHDDAYAWACRRTCLINQISGAIQIIDVNEVQATTEKLSSPQTTPTVQGRFIEISDEDLMALGIPEILLPAIRQVVSDTDVEAILPHLPPEASDALLMLGAGYELAEVKKQLDKTKSAQPIDTKDFAAALKRDDTLGQFMVLTDDDALQEMLAAPLEKWRVFLHPSQRKLINRNWNGPVRVLGGAGTGKTVVAMHRAKWLAQNPFTEPTDRILFTTFTRNLAEDIKLNLRSICSSETLQRIEVINLDRWVVQFFKQEEMEIKIPYSNDLESLWEQAYTVAPMELGLSLNFYQDEWQNVVLKYGCQSLKDYLQARRTGQGKRLSRPQKQQVWEVFEEYRSLLREKGYWEADEAMQKAAQLIQNQGSDLLPYRAVIVDEAQDMSQSAFQLIRAIAGTEHENDVFIVGDAHQRIYGKTITLSQCQINIVGRSRKLRLNYRTTDEIRQWSAAILRDTTVDDLDGGQDSLADYRSLLHGENPIVQGFSSQRSEFQAIGDRLASFQSQNQPLSSICLVFRTHKILDTYQQYLRSKDFKTKIIEADKADNNQQADHVRLATMHRVKGLQFDYIFLPSLNYNILPLQSVVEKCADESSQNRFIQGEKCLLYVAATRAKKQVFASYFGKASDLIQ